MSLMVYEEDISPDLVLKGDIAIDTEAMGLLPVRDRLCLVQLKDEEGQTVLVHFASDSAYQAPYLTRLLTNPLQTKIFHFARFDIALLYQWLGCWTAPIFCTKMASKLVRTYARHHGLKDLCQDLLKVELSKQEQASDWGALQLSEKQLKYAASDVLYLHDLKKRLTQMLLREKRLELAEKVFQGIQARAQLDLMGWREEDIYAH